VKLPLVSYFQPALANGTAGTPTNQKPDYELLLNADITPLTAGPSPAPAPAEAPAIGKLKVKPRRFRAASSGASVTRRLRVGATVAYTLSTDATVTFRVERAKKGRRRAGGCRKASRAARARRCTRFVSVPGSFTLAGTPGDNRFAFSGRIGERKLRKGRYRLSATPATSTLTGPAAHARFRIG
jgi:hypothetical protein